MKINKRSIVLIFFVSLVANTVKCQSNDECRYLMVLNYLRSSKVIKEKADMYFSKIADKKNRYTEFNLSDRIDFIGISYFRDQIKLVSNENYKELDNDSLYDRENYFKSSRSEFLRKIQVPNDSKLYLTFSKPVSNYLVIELRNMDPEMDGNRKFGKAMLVLFKFNPDGTIGDALFAGAAYN